MTDLKQLILMIADQKEVNANYSLDQGCVLENADPKKFVQIVNYIYNFVHQFSQNTIEVVLELRDKNYLLSFIVDAGKDPGAMAFSAQANEAIQALNANSSILLDNGRMIRITLTFHK